MAQFFSRVRKDLVIAVLATTGALVGLTGCKSSPEASYRPAPATTQQTPTYSQPSYSQPTYTAPAAPKPAAPPQMACGKGKCG